MSGERAPCRHEQVGPGGNQWHDRGQVPRLQGQPQARDDVAPWTVTSLNKDWDVGQKEGRARLIDSASKAEL